ncbi:hypothetical protein CAEBREN_10244 [Caenorhabditis brenneri]|uniref:Uncharacterized protein n=1 Tax=Caenorhabditis brenneri TaxID=135651 RepID=G0NZV6_CAEBE|nr:hypothetical protein CAEBREN_10244 [Caenorhabditis brenneri]
MKLFLLLLPLSFLVVSVTAQLEKKEIVITETTDMNEIEAWHEYSLTCNHEKCKTTCEEDYKRESECRTTYVFMKTCWCIQK